MAANDVEYAPGAPNIIQKYTRPAVSKILNKVVQAEGSVMEKVTTTVDTALRYFALGVILVSVSAFIYHHRASKTVKRIRGKLF